MREPANDVGDQSVSAVVERGKGDPFFSYILVMGFACICMSAYASGSAGNYCPISLMWPLPLLFVVSLPIICVWKNTFSINTGSVYLNVLANGFVGLVYYLSILVVLEPVGKLFSAYWSYLNHPPLG